MSKTEEAERYITVGFIGEADIDKEATPEATLENLINISEQCGYMTGRGVWGQYDKEIIISTPEGTFFISYTRMTINEDYKFNGVFVKKRIQ